MTPGTHVRASRARPKLHEIGADPDPRFTFANERTFLAWNRTALALVGGGLAAGQFLDFDSTAARLVVALPPIGLGAVLAVMSYHRWERNERALRLGEPLPAARAPRVLPWGIAALAVMIAVVVIINAPR